MGANPYMVQQSEELMSVVGCAGGSAQSNFFVLYDQHGRSGGLRGLRGLNVAQSVALLKGRE